MPMQKKAKTRTVNKNSKIPPPPGPDSSCEEIDSYFSKYSFEELEAAGIMRTLTAEENEWIEKISKVAAANVKARKGKAKQLNLALSEEQLARFTKFANKKHIPPSTLARAWILERLDEELNEASG